MCRGRHRVENRVVEVQVQCGAGRGGVGVTYFADRICTVLQIFPLSPENRGSVCQSVAKIMEQHSRRLPNLKQKKMVLALHGFESLSPQCTWHSLYLKLNL